MHELQKCFGVFIEHLENPNVRNGTDEGEQKALHRRNGQIQVVRGREGEYGGDEGYDCRIDGKLDLTVPLF